jgi:hypothetical protein
VVDEVLEAEAIAEETDGEEPSPTPLPAEQTPGEVSILRDEAKTVAIAAAGGVVAGAATVAVVKAASRVATPRQRSRRRLLRRSKQNEIIASRSFLVDVHLLGR